MATKPTIKYDILGPDAPPMPEKLPKIISLAIQNVPQHMKPAIATSLFPALGSLMHNVRFRYIDNVLHEPHFMCGLVGPQAVGKGCINPIIETLIRSLRENDAQSNARLSEWKRQYKAAGANKQKPDRPTDAAILAPEPDMTNPALIQLLLDAEAAGNRFLYTNIPEIDLLDQCCGGHRKVTRVIRLAYDISHYGAQRATADGISGNPLLRWNFNFSCVERKAQQFFKDALDDGTFSRIGFAYVVRPQDRSGVVPKQGDYSASYQRQMDAFLVRLQAASGEIDCPQAAVLAAQLAKEMALIAGLSDDDDFEALSFRAVVIAWLKACVLYVAEGYKWSRAIAAFARWSLYYDLWSKFALFAIKLREQRTTVDTTKTRQHGPSNMLLKLPEVFTYADYMLVRQQEGRSEHRAAVLLSTWEKRGYIKPLPDGTYKKLAYLTTQQ